MSRTIKNKNLLSFRNISESTIRHDSWRYGWVDCGDGFVQWGQVAEHSPHELYLKRRQYQGERTWHYIIGTVPKWARGVQQKRYRAEMNRKIKKFEKGIAEDVIPAFHSKNPHYAYT